jgi:flagella basal body P-ring formation protein FlgA
MRPIRQLCVALVGALLLGTSAAGATGEVSSKPAVQLRAQPAVSGETITLGDVFDGTGEQAHVPVAASPPPGQSLLIDTKSLAALLSAHGLAWAAGAATVRVERLSREVRADEIARAIGASLSRETGRSLDVRPLHSALVLQAPATSAGALDVEIVSLDNATGRFEATVRIAGGSGTRITGVADEVMNVPVLARPFQRGETIKEADLTWINLRIGTMSRSLITDAKALVGLAAKRPLRSGQPIQASDIEHPIIVAKGALVTIAYEVPGLSLTDSGRALEQGAIGDTISVLNPSSHRTLFAIVVSSDRVRLEPSSHAATALNIAAR